jgi:hypothetical protein
MIHAPEPEPDPEPSAAPSSVPTRRNGHRPPQVEKVAPQALSAADRSTFDAMARSLEVIARCLRALTVAVISLLTVVPVVALIEYVVNSGWHV